MLRCWKHCINDPGWEESIEDLLEKKRESMQKCKQKNIISGHETNNKKVAQSHLKLGKQVSLYIFICALLAVWQCYVAFYRHAGFVDKLCFLKKTKTILMMFIKSVLLV
ncbi:hypothetical protein FQA47_021344 [Oryzias melastigma]|uniref:Uncharacterized protein n=1 Tax=Oryzias melastigma TaxID=30732 RepID=A0A834KYC3_ORYME|nr:hypothetical protein FQA47_021344 [Oryzias melastigma]